MTTSATSSTKKLPTNAVTAGIRNSAPVTMPRPAMIESTQASAVQAACGAKPAVCSAQVAPFSASAANTRCSAMPMMTISSKARPTDFISTARNAWLNIWESAWTAASIMPATGRHSPAGEQGGLKAYDRDHMRAAGKALPKLKEPDLAIVGVIAMNPAPPAYDHDH